MGSKLFKFVILPLVIILIIQRFFHLYTFIENPHSWRQLDTLFYAYDYYKNGIDFFAPSVAWMGSYKTLILEFPVLSALLSFTFYLPGDETIWMRLICFGIFLISAWYLYRLVALFNSKSLAAFTAMIYMMLPLSVYYSRALLIDFTVMFCCLATMYYYVIGLRENNFKFFLVGTIFAGLAALTKVPYLFIAYFPVGYYIIKEKTYKTLFRYSFLFILPVILFIFWQWHVTGVNSNAPDWFFIPDYFKYDEMSHWYFGSFDERLNLENWKTILIRGSESVISFTGLLFLISGIFLKSRGIEKSFFNFYSIGLLAYLIIFFKLNYIHDYYQIPFLIASAFYIGVTIEFIYRKFYESNTKAIIYVGICMIILAVNGIWFAERWYYKPDMIRIESAEFIKVNTEEDNLIIASIEDTDPRDPRILASAYRYGWSIRSMDISKNLIDSLKANGADYLVFIGTEQDLKNKLSTYLSEFTLENRKLLQIEDPGKEVLIYELQ